MSKFFITTTLPYVNAEPHIAHALEFVLADAIARYQRQNLGDKNVFFNVGTDEHGQKIWEKSFQEGLAIHDFTDKYVERFVQFCKLFDVSYDFFYRTSKPYHYPVAQAFWNEATKSGDIYKKKYKGLYCVGCERFRTEKELVDGKCPDHGVPPIEFEEENYFFKLSKYRDVILKYLQESEFVIPVEARNFAIEFCKSELEDISISRDKKNLSWGVPIPGDDSQVMYVWFDALSNYIGAITYQGDTDQTFTIEKARATMEDWEMIQLCGSDNIRFQSIIWQGMLQSCGLPFSKKLLVHAWILGADGRKMSKTLGNVVSPFAELEKYGKDAVRYFFLACMPTSGDAVYNSEEFKNVYNAALADNFGNLLNRVIVLKEKLQEKIMVEITDANFIPDISTPHGLVLNPDEAFISRVDELATAAKMHMERYDVFAYCRAANEIGNLANLYMTQKAPWSKECTNPATVLSNVTYSLYILISLYSPIIPSSCEKAKEMLDNNEKGVLFEKIL